MFTSFEGNISCIFDERYSKLPTVHLLRQRIYPKINTRNSYTMAFRYLLLTSRYHFFNFERETTEAYKRHCVLCKDVLSFVFQIKNIIMCSFKSSGYIQKKDGGPDKLLTFMFCVLAFVFCVLCCW